MVQRDGDRRADDWAGAGNRGKVMTEDDRLAGGHIVDAILQPFAGADRVGREPEDFATQPTTVGVVGDDKSDSGQERDEQSFHGNRDGHASGKRP